MLNINLFFDKFRNVALKEMAVRDTMLDAIKKNLPAGLAENPAIAAELIIQNIEFKNRIIRLRVSPILKSQIFMKKEPILKMIRENNPQSIISDIQ